jgi:phage protein D/phage baseplate assembly protein gpV
MTQTRARPTHHIAQIYIELDGTNLDPQQYMPRLISVEVDDSLYLPDMFSITLSDPGLEALNADLFKPGTMVKISMQQQSSGDDNPPKVVLMEGEITAVEPELNPNERTVITARGYDKSHRMHRIRRTETYLNVSDSDLASRLAQRSGLQAQVTSTTPVYPYIMQANQTDWEFLMERAQRIGYRLYVEGNKLYFQPPPPSPPETRLEWGINLSHFRPRVTTVDQVNEVVVRGWDPKKKAQIVGRATSPSGALSNRKDNGRTGGVLAQQAHSVQSKQVVVDRPVYTQAEADKVAQSVLDKRSSSFVQAEGTCGGDPNVRAGTAINVTSVGSRFGGKYLVTRAVHRYRHKEYSVHFWVSGGEDTITGILSKSSHDTAQDGTNPGAKPTARGITVGLVTDNNDPENRGRVKVKLTSLGENIESFWCPLVSTNAGNKRGIAFLPEVNDEVVVAFQNGDPNHGYVLGAVWNGSDALPKPTGQLLSGNQVVRRVIRSRVGHEIVIVDNPITPEGIIIIDKTTNNFIKVMTQPDKIEIQCQADIQVTSKTGNITATADTGNVTVKASAGKVTVQAMQDLELKSDTGKVTISGTAGVDINSPAIINIKGSMTNIN